MLFDKNTENTIIEMNKYIKMESPLKNSEIIDFQIWLNHEDAWVSKDKVLKNIRSLKTDTNYIIVGFSEYARFLSMTIKGFLALSS
jgi:hypothetical protein